MRLAIPEQALLEPVLPKVRALPHKRRGVGISGKGRRGSLNLLSNCRTPPYYTEEELKTSPLSQSKRKIKAPADLDLTLVTEDIKNGNGKRIRAKSRSAPSTPQGKSDPVFLDQACPSPMLIDCPHPNCNKKYKHINGLRYHQSHAHLDTDRKQDFEVENEDRLTDEEEGGPLRGLAFSCTETSSSSKKANSPPKLGVLGPPKGRKMMLNNEPGPIITSKSRRHSVTKEGPTDDLSNLPIISNMTVVLENCLITDRSSSVEMPKLEAEDVIDKREVDDPSKKEMGKTEKCSSKARAGRFIVTPSAPPKLIAIPTTTFSASSAEASCHHSSPTVALTKAKSLSLKPIKPKLDIILQSNLPSSTLATCKESKRKEKQRLKDRHCKDIRSTKPENIHVKMEDSKGLGKDFSISLLKEHLSKQEVSNGPSETQESRMASIRAEADKVYTFTDNAPSPSIGGCSRLDSNALANGEGTSSKTNSPAYSDISDAVDDGGSDGRLNTKIKVNAAAVEPSPGHSTNARVASGALKEAQSSPLYHGYDSYCLQGFVHAGQTNSSTFLKVSAAYDGKAKKEDFKEAPEEFKMTESSDVKKKDMCPAGAQSQLQMAITDTQTALVQSLYYGQYSRSIKVDQKLLTLSAGSHSRPPMETGSDDMQQNKQKGPQAVRDLEHREQQKDDARDMPLSSVISKGVSSVKSSGSKVGHPYLELDKQQVKSSLLAMIKDQRLEHDELKSGKDLTEQIQLDSNVSHVNVSGHNVFSS